MEDIILGGVSLNNLKELQAKIRPEANKFISDGIDEASSIMDAMLELKDVKAMEVEAAKAIAILERVEVVAGITGMTFYLPYTNSWGDYDETPYSHRIENFGDDLVMDDEGESIVEAVQNSEVLSNLYHILEGMEYDSRNWHESRC